MRATPISITRAAVFALAAAHVTQSSAQHAQSLRDDAPARIAPASLPTLQRTVRCFDFDETDVAPDALPNHFYRYIAPNQGFPPFGAMRIAPADESASVTSNGGAFLFELAGGSMSARLSTSVIPVLPLADYAVSTRVRTQGLRHARARLVAWLHDDAGNLIPESVVHSQPVDTAGQWESLVVEIHGDFPKAADLVVELQLVQPAQLESLAANPNAPQIEDIGGRSWFDDLTISHLPRVTLVLAQPGNIAQQSQSPELHIMVSELSSERLMARLRVLNIDGNEVFDSTFPAPRGRQPGVIHLPIRNCGWYRAVLDVTSHDSLARRRWVDFAVVPERRAASGHGTTRLAVVLADAPPEVMPDIAELVHQLDVDTAMVPVWHRTTGTSADHIRHAARKQLIEGLLRRGLSIVFWLNVVPDDLGRLLNLEPNQVIDVLEHEPRLWRPYLDDLLVNFGLQVNRWHLSAPGSASTWQLNDLKSIVDGASRSFADFVPDSRIYTSWLAEHDPDSPDALAARAIVVPNQVRPEAVESYAKPWLDSGSDVFVTLELLPAHSFSPRRRASDMMLRTLFAWRAQLPEIAIQQPWQYSPGREPTLMPDPCFVPWRTLAQQLRGRSFVGELKLGPDIHCWILAGRGADDHAVVAWADVASPDARVTMRTQLSSSPLELVDAFGNSSTISPVDGMHTVALSDLPVFVEGVELEMVRFRSALAIEPGFVPAVSKIHEHQIVLQNPWSVAISGTIRLRSEDDWQLTPAVQDFAIRPGGEIRLPLSIIPQRNILAGRKQIDAEITLNADRAFRMRTQTSLEVGLPEIDLAASWSISRNLQTGEDDLIVAQAVTNRSTRPVNLSVFIQANNVGQNRKAISGLEPGDTAVRSFRIPGGATAMAGQQLRVGVAETDGPARLNHVLTITAPSEASVTSANP